MLRPRLSALLVATLLAWPAAAQDAAPPAPADNAADTHTHAGAGVDTGVGQDATPPQDPPGLILRDLVILQADHYGSAYNDPEDFTSTLFNNSPRRRPISPTPNATPMPLGFITLEGEAGPALAIRIDIATEAGRFLGHWPRGVAGEDYLVWHDIAGVPTPTGRMRIPDEHWLTPLRDDADRLSFNTRGHVDRFFAYDATFPFTPTFNLEGNAQDGYTISTPALPRQTLVMAVRRSEAGWQAGTLASDPSTEQAVLTLQPVDGPEGALAPILGLLESRGYNATERDTAAAILRESAMGDAAMSLIYIMSRDELDALLPLQVNDDNVEVHRTGIIVVNNVEPDIAGTVGKLIEQLASDDWLTRDNAQRALIEMDRAAITLVRENADHPDPEVAYRIEQVIAAFDRRHE